MTSAARVFSLPTVIAAAPAENAAQFSLAPALGAAAVIAAVSFWMHRTYRRRAEEARDTSERFRELFENAIEGVYETPPGGGFSKVNPAMARILGYASPEDVLKIPSERIAAIYLSPKRRDEFFATLGARDHVANFESEIRRPDGSTAWIVENVHAKRDANGRLLYVQGFVSDITERKRTEAALRASEERFRVLFEHLPIPVVEYNYQPTIEWLDELRRSGVTDLEAWLDAHPSELAAATSRVRIAGANPAALRLFGAKSISDAVANLERMYTPEVFAARRRTFVAVWAGARATHGEFGVRSLDGRELRIYFHWRVPVIEGRPMYERTQLALVDLTEIKAAERALAAERERLSVTLRAMSESVIATDPTGHVQYMNDAAGVLTGWNHAAAVGRPLGHVCALSSEQAGHAARSPLVEILTADRPIDLPPQTLLQTREGPTRRIEGRCAPMRDHGGRTIGFVLVMRDVTERTRMEAELMRASKLDSIGVLAGGIAHDFNNLLAVVMGNLTLALLDEKTAAAGGRWLKEAERGTVRAQELTQQLLTFAKGGEPLRAAVPLSDVVREAAEFALHGTKVKGEFDFAPDLPAADVDRGQIGQAVQNLVINAVQAMPGGGTLLIALGREALAADAVPPLPAGTYLRLEITDTGCGIPPQDLPRVFEPFFTIREQVGGLGLAAVYSIVRRHRGHVTVQSEVGRGSTFRVWLPAVASAPGPAAADKPGNAFQPVFGRVLFMDDEEAIRTMTAALLQRLGLEATVTSDGRAALETYRQAKAEGRPFDLVIMDLTVPGGMGGAEAMREILKVDPNARGIVSSGYSSDPVMANYRAHGFRGMVPKPYRIADFARTIREVMSGN